MQFSIMLVVLSWCCWVMVQLFVLVSIFIVLVLLNRLWMLFRIFWQVLIMKKLMWQFLFGFILCSGSELFRFLFLIQVFIMLFELQVMLVMMSWWFGVLFRCLIGMIGNIWLIVYMFGIDLNMLKLMKYLLIRCLFSLFSIG